jgi:hypothetical protein
MPLMDCLLQGQLAQWFGDVDPDRNCAILAFADLLLCSHRLTAAYHPVLSGATMSLGTRSALEEFAVSSQDEQVPEHVRAL